MGFCGSVNRNNRLFREEVGGGFPFLLSSVPLLVYYSRTPHPFLTPPSQTALPSRLPHRLQRMQNIFVEPVSLCKERVDLEKLL